MGQQILRRLVRLVQRQLLERELQILEQQVPRSQPQHHKQQAYLILAPDRQRLGDLERSLERNEEHRIKFTKPLGIDLVTNSLVYVSICL